MSTSEASSASPLTSTDPNASENDQNEMSEVRSDEEAESHPSTSPEKKEYVHAGITEVMVEVEPPPSTSRVSSTSEEEEEHEDIEITAVVNEVGPRPSMSRVNSTSEEEEEDEDIEITAVVNEVEPRPSKSRVNSTSEEEEEQEDIEITAVVNKVEPRPSTSRVNSTSEEEEEQEDIEITSVVNEVEPRPSASRVNSTSQEEEKHEQTGITAVIDEGEPCPSTSRVNSSSQEEEAHVQTGITVVIDEVEPRPSTSRVNKVTEEVIKREGGVETGSLESAKYSSESSSHNDDNGTKGVNEPGQYSLSIPDNESTRFDGMTRRQLLSLSVLALSDFAGAILLTNQNPWFPIQAKENGLSVGLTGVVFGAFELACFICLPLFQGKIHQSCITPQTLFLLGIFTTSSCSILFAFLGYVSDWSLFLGFSILLRFIEGMGQAAFIKASFTIIALEFPTAVSSAFVSLETFFGLGLVVGPPLGGTLWDSLPAPKRFTVTYGVLGLVLFIVGIIGLLFLPQSRGDHVNELERNGYTGGYRVFALLKVSSVPLVGFGVLCMAVSVGFLYVTLSPLLAEFGMHPVLLGGIFLLNGGTAALTAPVFARLIDFTHRSKLMMIFGAVLIFVGFSLMGPATFIPLQTTPWLISIGLFLHGLGIASLCASTFKLMLYQAVKSGYADNIKTYWLVSSLWTHIFCCGTLIGTISSGFLFDSFRFRDASWFILGLQIIVIIFTLLSMLSVGIIKFQTSPKRSTLSYTALDTESEPLLGSAQRSKFNTIHQKSKPRKRILSEPSFTEPKISPRKSYGGIESILDPPDD